MLPKDFAEQFFSCGTIFSTPQGNLLVGWGKRNWQAKPSIKKSFLSFYFSDFFLKKKKPWYTHQHFASLEIDQFLKNLESFSLESVFPLVWSNSYEEFYAKQFSVLKELIDKQEFEKGVPFVYETSVASMKPTYLFHALKHAVHYIQKFPAHLYGFWENGEGILGATPEILFHLNHLKLSTVALGGSFSPNGPRKDSEDKLIKEHQLIVEGLKNSLKDFGEITISNPSWLELPYICHLMTHLEVFLEKKPPLHSLIKAIHPTPALGCYPKSKGAKWLQYYQNLIDRRYFGSPVGYDWIEKKESVFYVAIRNIQWVPGQFLIGAGGGVVKESHLEMEWKEILTKIGSVKSIFNL